ncbi:MAG: ribosome biogenesis GTP-binding protein YihA/YsxC [Gemmatimonadota bacterium]
MPNPVRDPLVIKHLEFLGGLAAPGGWRPEHSLPEVAFAGRSNVGKSSLLNKLVRRKKLARVSNTPGRTREVNFFQVNDQFVLVDLPGYGYARVSKDTRAAWRPLIEGVLRGSPGLRGIVLLLDARHEPSPEDLQMLEFLAELGTPAIIVVTKVDKLTKSARDARLASLAAQAGIEADQMIPFSAVTGEGRDELAEAVVALVTQTTDTY